MPSVNSREKNKKKRKFIFFFFLLAFSLFSLFLATICIVKGSYRCPWEFGAILLLIHDGDNLLVLKAIEYFVN